MEKCNNVIINIILDHFTNIQSTKAVFQHTWSINIYGGCFRRRYTCQNCVTSSGYKANIKNLWCINVWSHILLSSHIKPPNHSRPRSLHFQKKRRCIVYDLNTIPSSTNSRKFFAQKELMPNTMLLFLPLTDDEIL